jgi:hypothetical protein
MTITIELDPATEERLKAIAAQHGLAPEDYVGEFLRDNLPFANGTGILKPGDVEKMTEELTRGMEDRPVLPPEANNRDFYYEDRL